mgnify:FL=1
MMENVNNEDQIAKNMEPVQDNTPLDDDFYYENDDFDLDNDLKPVGERGYVPLTPKKEAEDADAYDNEEAPDAVEEADKAEEEHIGEAIAKEAEEADAESNEAAEECSGTETSEQ